MTTESYIVSLSALLVGIVIGYYKAGKEDAEKLMKYVSQKDCVACPAKTGMHDISEELKTGTALFSEIKTQLALYKQTVEGLQKEFDKFKSQQGG